MALKLKAKYPADRSKLELTGEPISITLHKIIYSKNNYKNCPLKDTGQCPVEEKVNLLDPPRVWDNPCDRKEKDRENVKG
jgi:hypothetical protein